MSKAIQKFVVSHGDPREFVKLMLEYGKQGAYLPDDEYAHISSYPKHVKLAIELKEGMVIERSATVIAFDPVYDAKSFTEEELDAMEWLELKELGKAVGVSHRDRKQLQRKYLELIGSDDSGDKVEVTIPVEKAAKVAKKVKADKVEVVEKVVDKSTEIEVVEKVAEKPVKEDVAE